MKLKLDLWHHLLGVYTKFQIDISKHVEKSLENFERSETQKNYCQNYENKIKKDGTYVEKYTVGHQCSKFQGFILIYEAMIAKNGFGLLLAIN